MEEQRRWRWKAGDEGGLYIYLLFAALTFAWQRFWFLRMLLIFGLGLELELEFNGVWR